MSSDELEKLKERDKRMRAARDEILRRVGLWLKEMGYHKAGNAHYTMTTDGYVWHIGFQKLSSGRNVRVTCYLINEDGTGKSIYGPQSDPYTYRDSPSGKPYWFAWTSREADIARSAEQYCRYIEEVVIEWFKKNTKNSKMA